MPEDVYICAAYLAPINSSYAHKAQNASLFDVLEDEISKYSRKGQVILLGDLNERVNVKDLVFCLKSRSTIFQSCWDGATASWVFTSTLGSLKCLVQGHFAAVVGFEHWTSRSGVRHYTTEPPRPLNLFPQCYIADNIYFNRNSQDKGPTNEQGKQLSDFCIGTRMELLNSRTLEDTQGRLTCHHYNGSSAVDWCLVSSEVLDSVLYFKVNEFLTLSDHCPITVGLIVQVLLLTRRLNYFHCLHR